MARTDFADDIFQTFGARFFINKLDELYGSRLEFLWRNLPDTAIWRRADTKKWFGIIYILKREKLTKISESRSLDSEFVEVISFRIAPDELDKIVDNKTYFRAYHMNKRRWCSVILDDLSYEQMECILERIGYSYNNAK